jgi:hypothetical protein
VVQSKAIDTDDLLEQVRQNPRAKGADRGVTFGAKVLFSEPVTFGLTNWPHLETNR